MGSGLVIVTLDTDVMLIRTELLTLHSISFIFESIEGEATPVSDVASGDDLVVTSRKGVTSIFFMHIFLIKKIEYCTTFDQSFRSVD